LEKEREREKRRGARVGKGKGQGPSSKAAIPFLLFDSEQRREDWGRSAGRLRRLPALLVTAAAGFRGKRGR
jgi:hypothetical protein